MRALRRRIRVDGKRVVSAVWRIPDRFETGNRRIVLIAHGAGGNMDGAFIEHLHRGLAERGCLTVKFNFPYAEEGRKAPDRAPLLERTWRAVIERVRDDSRCRQGRLYLSGKSLGGRIASHVAADTRPAGLVFFGFPLHPPARHDTRRAERLLDAAVPSLFIQGTRDPLCDLELLDAVLAGLKAPHGLHIIDGGDHSFRVPKRTGRSETSVWREIVEVTDEWTGANRRSDD